MQQKMIKRERILVTGGSGFIGSTLVELLLAKGYLVFNLDILTYAANKLSSKEVSQNPNYIHRCVDITDGSAVHQAINEFQPDGLIHLAAESHVDRSIEDPDSFINTNIVGTYTLLRVATDYWQKNYQKNNFLFLHVSTDEVYGSLSLQSKIVFDEKTRYDPSSPYSASKASSDMMVSAWGQTYQLPYIITNCSNNYGPKQHPEKLIPKAIIHALLQKPIPIYGDGKNIRDWLFVKDHATALLSIIESDILNTTYCIGTRNEVDNVTIVQEICKILNELKPPKNGNYSDLITYVQDRAGHDRRYAIDPSKIQNELGWSAECSFEDGLRQTVQWYLKNAEWLAAYNGSYADF